MRGYVVHVFDKYQGDSAAGGICHSQKYHKYIFDVISDNFLLTKQMQTESNA